MGYELYREVKVWAPESLTPREKLAALVIADDANDASRITWSSVSDPEIMRQAMVPDDRAMRRIITKLKREKVLEHLGGGHNGRAAKYRFLHLAPAGGGKQGGNHPATDRVAGSESPAYANETTGRGEQNRPATDHVAGQISPSSRVNSTLPTPYPSTTSPSAAEAVDKPPTGDTGQGEDHTSTTPQDTAVAFLETLPAPWSVGHVTAKALAPRLAERAAERHWTLGPELAAELTKNPGGINNHRAVLRTRIEDLPYRAKLPAPRAADAPERACVDCGRPHPNLTDTGICPPCLSGQGRGDRRPMPADFRAALRRSTTGGTT